MTAAERSKKYYHKRKLEEPQQHREFLEMRRARVKVWRQNKKATATKEEKELQRAKNRERAAKYRKIKKEKGEMPQQKKKTVTKFKMRQNQKNKVTQHENEMEKMKIQRAKDAERKKAARASWSWEKKKAESLKALERYRLRKMKKVQEELNKENPADEDRSGETITQALSRVHESQPINPAFRPQTIQDLKFWSHSGEDKGQSLKNLQPFLQIVLI